MIFYLKCTFNNILVKQCDNFIKVLEFNDIICYRNYVSNGYNFISAIYYKLLQIISKLIKSSKKRHSKIYNTKKKLYDVLDLTLKSYDY